MQSLSSLLRNYKNNNHNESNSYDNNLKTADFLIIRVLPF